MLTQQHTLSNADTTGVAMLWRGYSAPCGEVTKDVARLLSLCGEVTKSMARLSVAMLPVTFCSHLSFGSLK